MEAKLTALIQTGFFFLSVLARLHITIHDVPWI